MTKRSLTSRRNKAYGLRAQCWPFCCAARKRKLRTSPLSKDSPPPPLAASSSVHWKSKRTQPQTSNKACSDFAPAPLARPSDHATKPAHFHTLQQALRPRKKGIASPLPKRIGNAPSMSFEIQSGKATISRRLMILRLGLFVWSCSRPTAQE